MEVDDGRRWREDGENDVRDVMCPTVSRQIQIQVLAGKSIQLLSNPMGWKVEARRTDVINFLVSSVHQCLKEAGVIWKHHGRRQTDDINSFISASSVR